MIGAGMAGVSAASKLAEEGWDVTVLERRLRIGGRIKSHTCKAMYGVTPVLRACLGIRSIDLPGCCICMMLNLLTVRCRRVPIITKTPAANQDNEGGRHVHLQGVRV